MRRYPSTLLTLTEARLGALTALSIRASHVRQGEIVGDALAVMRSEISRRDLGFDHVMTHRRVVGLAHLARLSPLIEQPVVR